MKESLGENKSYTHLLQRIGVLKNFSIAKVITKKEIDDLKKLIRAVSKDEKEYEKLLAEEMTQVANMHDTKNPVPGIIYEEDMEKKINGLKASAKEYSIKMKNSKLTKQELCFLIATIIRNLGLTKDDFIRLDNDNSDPEDDKESA